MSGIVACRGGEQKQRKAVRGHGSCHGSVESASWAARTRYSYSHVACERSRFSYESSLGLAHVKKFQLVT